MSKVKSGDMPHYELLYIISNKYSEEEIKPIIEKINSLIVNNQGEITINENLGKKRLSYPIKSFRFGYYILVEFNMAGENLLKVDLAMRMMNEILRHQIVIKLLKTAEQIEKDRKIAEKVAAKNIKEEKIAEKKVKEQDKGKVDLKDLDEKLDKILETENLL